MLCMVCKKRLSRVAHQSLVYPKQVFLCITCTEEVYQECVRRVGGKKIPVRRTKGGPCQQR